MAPWCAPRLSKSRKQTEWQTREGMLSSTKQLRAQRADTRTPTRAVRSGALDASQISKLGTILATRAPTFESCRKVPGALEKRESTGISQTQRPQQQTYQTHFRIHFLP